MRKRRARSAQAQNYARGERRRHESAGPPDFSAWWRLRFAHHADYVLLNVAKARPLDLCAERSRLDCEMYWRHASLLTHKVSPRMRSA